MLIFSCFFYCAQVTNCQTSANVSSGSSGSAAASASAPAQVPMALYKLCSPL